MSVFDLFPLKSLAPVRSVIDVISYFYVMFIICLAMLSFSCVCYFLLCYAMLFAMFYYVLLCVAMFLLRFCYVFAMFCYVLL